MDKKICHVLFKGEGNSFFFPYFNGAYNSGIENITRRHQKKKRSEFSLSNTFSGEELTTGGKGFLVNHLNNRFVTTAP